MAGVDGTVVVSVNTDEFIERFKGRPPVQSFRERKLMLESCRYVDQVIENVGEEDSAYTIQQFSQTCPVDIVAIGSDWAGRDYYGQMGFTKEWLDDMNIVLVYVDRRTGQSTTNLKKTLKDY